jgi:hypothetical protein
VAQALCGADAVAGVVNFIMNDRFEGVQIELNGSGYNHKQQGTAGVSSLVAGRAATNPAQFAVPGNKGLDGRSKDASLLIVVTSATAKVTPPCSSATNKTTRCCNPSVTSPLARCRLRLLASLAAVRAPMLPAVSPTPKPARFTPPMLTVPHACSTTRWTSTTSARSTTCSVLTNVMA